MNLSPEYHFLYKSLQIHHLEEDEIDYELLIRAIQTEDKEARSTKLRKLKQFVKNEKVPFEGVDLARYDVSIDQEIKLVDNRVDEIRQYLQKNKKYSGVIDALRSRLIHCLFRLVRLEVIPNLSRDDSVDISTLIGLIRRLINDYFSMFSPFPEIQKKVIEELNRSFSSARVSNPKQSSESEEDEYSEKEKGSGAQSEEGEIADVSDNNNDKAGKTKKKHKQKNTKSSKPKSNTLAKRKLKSTINQQFKDQINPFANSQFTNPMNSLINPFMNPYFQSFLPMQFYSHQSGFPDLSSFGSGQLRRRNKSKSKKKPNARVGRTHESESSSEVEVESLSSESSSSESSGGAHKRRTIKRSHNKTSKTINDWKIKYSGRDNGERLLDFLKEVKFHAKSDHLDEDDLFDSAIYLFTDKAKTWYMNGVDNEEFRSWKELVKELKREFLTHDHDYQSEFKAITRRQGPKEKFKDFMYEMQKIFDSRTQPMTEKKKFEIVFRNMRSDYKSHAVSSEIDNLVDLKNMGRKLDEVFRYKYNNTSENYQKPKNSQVSELKSFSRPTNNKSKSENSSKSIKTKTFYSSKESENTKPKEKAHTTSDTNKTNTPEKPLSTADPMQGSCAGTLNKLLDQYTPPKPGVCFNCREYGHHFNDCEEEFEKFCKRCGFHDTDTFKCPYCAKNAQ